MGYGSKDKPVPWLGPQAWIKEVHWPNNREIRVDVTVRFSATGNVQGGPGSGASLPAPTHLGGGYITGDRLEWPPPPEPPYPPFPDAKISNGRQAQSGDVNPFEQDLISKDNITFEDMPILPGSATQDYGPWAFFSTGTHPVEPTGSFTDFRATDDGSKRFREGTDVRFRLWGIPFAGPVGNYGGVIGAPLAGEPVWPDSYITQTGELTLNFSATTFHYKNRIYKPHARYIAGPYEKNQTPIARPVGFSFALLCKVERS